MMKKNPAFAAASGASTVSNGPRLVAPQPKVPIIPANLPSKVVYAATPSPGVGTGASSGSIGTPTSAAGTPGAAEDLLRKVAEARKRVADAQTKLAVKDNPYMAVAQSAKRTKSSGSTPIEQTQQGAGLKMAAHPLLLDTTPTLPQSKKDRYKPMQPKFASIKANVRNQPSPQPTPSSMVPSVVPSPAVGANPYMSAAAAAAAAAAGAGAGGTGPGGKSEVGVFDSAPAPRERVGRQFKFNQKGRYVALGNQMRQENQLEQLKQRIAESARKAGLDGDMGVEKAIKRPLPPDAEWWDVALLPSKSYSDLDNLGMQTISAVTIRNPESPITMYIQHPIPIPAPGEKDKVELKPMMLTKKEQKKMRKLKRKSELQDKRDRIRMGLLPPDPPKVRLSNLMKVLTSDAVQDPTRVEARVRREVAMRKHQHEKLNAERKLTDDQRREKLETKKSDEERKGLFGAVFKVLNLSDPSHQFKVRKNADQLNLSGVCIFNPNFTVVYVEGAAKFIKNYKRLMLHRIAWTESARPRGGGAAEDVELENPESDVEGEGGNGGSGAAAASSSTAAAGAAGAKTPGDGGDEEVVKSLEGNKCFLIWEGALRQREFNAFKARTCPTDREAREFLGERLKGHWDVAKNWRAEEEEMY
ncbi:pre-mRNA processing factor 3-domain-containing protein [Gymnopilus junonius]|uniref:Pre-mRNA processing factor 3-domain-containing protein n=1 Tax=Gymnopilus junonius TaxID=109634 RepID=A0A9P5NXH2_GYMJU|nr:pre-mRNA processing factor 3-domain-containing protein [Gymnopilus junonius]